MNRLCHTTLLLAAFAALELTSLSAAQARGGGSSFMNSPGYQRRLQESRGYVTNQSGSVFSTPRVVTEPRIVRPIRRHHRH